MLPEQASTFNNMGRGGFHHQRRVDPVHIDYRGYLRDTLAIAAHEGWPNTRSRPFASSFPSGWKRAWPPTWKASASIAKENLSSLRSGIASGGRCCATPWKTAN